MPASVLIVEDEKNTREGLSRVLQEEYEIFEATDADQAFRLMDQEPFDVILTDLRMAGKSGLSVIDKAMNLPNRPICIMMTAYGNVETAVEAMKRGAFDFLTKPVSLEKLEIIIRRALQSKHLEKENEELHERLDEKYKYQTGIIGQSSLLLDALEKAKLVSASKTSVLLTGETGTGKELFAQMIHQNSSRARQPFLAVHCAALPANLLESELFGHEKGAFTGASQIRIGRFEAADGGTLFLDEIGEIDSSIQVKLLRFLETKSFEKVGSSKNIKVDVRVICATNRDLEFMVNKGEFREDLYYRLNVVSIKLPSLRERKEDIPVFINHFLDYLSKENAVEIPRLTTEAYTILQNYSWPGNIREVRNFCEHLVVMKSGQKVTEYDLEPKFTKQLSIVSAKDAFPKVLLKEANEKQLIAKVLAEVGGNKTKAAELLGISRRTLHRKIAQWPELDKNV